MDFIHNNNGNIEFLMSQQDKILHVRPNKDFSGHEILGSYAIEGFEDLHYGGLAIGHGDLEGYAFFGTGRYLHRIPLAQFTTIPAPGAIGDLNRDGVVDVDDLFILLAAWGECADPDNCPADLNEDGVVDVDDLFILLANWG